MQRHGDAGGHVYTLPSSRLRGGGGGATGASSTSTSSPGSPSNAQQQQGSVSAGHSPVIEARLAGPSPSNTPRRYDGKRWSLISLKRSSTGPRSLPSTPAAETAPATAASAATTTTQPPLAYLIATLLHLPTQVLYAWPIALKGAVPGKCFVTQPSPSQRPADHASYDDAAVLSESIKVLADVVSAWVKTSPMRESLRRKESRRQRGSRKLGESEQDAIWLNESLGLAELDEHVRLRTVERIWMDNAESVTPPVTSPTNANTPSSRPQTPRIEVTSADGDFFNSAAAGHNTPPPHPSSSATPVEEAIVKANTQQAAIEQEITQWMNSASLSDFTRSRPENARKSAMSTGGSSSASSSGTSSPVQKARKSVTFSELAAMGGEGASASHAYRPPFAPDVIDLPTPSEEEAEVAALSLPPSAAAATASASTTAPKATTMTTAMMAANGRSRSGSSSGSGSGSSNNANANSATPSTPSAPRPILTSFLPPPGAAHRSHDMQRATSADGVMSLPPPPTSPGLSPTTATRHRKTTSKLSQEIPQDDGSSTRSGSGGGSARLSPSQSFAELKSAFRSLKGGHKKKLSTTST